MNNNKPVAHHPAKSKAENPKGFFVAVVWLASVATALGGAGVILLHMVRGLG